MPGKRKSSENDTGLLNKSRPVFLKIANIIKPHGLHGELVVEFSSDIPESLLAGADLFVGDFRMHVQVARLRRMNQRYLLMLEGTTSRDAAEEYRGATIYLRQGDIPELPEGEFYFHQLIGLVVQNLNGEKIGILSEIIQTGANDVYVVKPEDGKDLLFPAIQSVVKEIDIDNGILTIDPPDWY